MGNDKNYIKLILGLKIKQLRQENMLSLNELAAKSSMSVSYLNEIENGKKYPKPEKIAQLAQALGVSYDELISLKLTKTLTPIAELIDSNILEMLPLDHYGIDLHKFISLMANASYQLSALVTTVIEMAKSTELSQNNFSRTAFRIYKEIHENYFDDIESAVDSFVKKFKIDTNPPLNYQELFSILSTQYNYRLDETRLNTFKELEKLRGILKNGKEPILYLNSNLSIAQKLFIIGKEIAYNYLNIKNRSFIHSSLKLNTFDHLLNNYIAAYFSTALILYKKNFIPDINDFFSLNKWDGNFIINLIKKYDATPEMFFQRLANLSGKVWKLKKYFFLRFNTFAGTDKFDLNKEVRLNINQNPGGYQTNEHYCRRWISIEVLKKIKDNINLENSNSSMIAGILHSRFNNTNDEFLSFSVAHPNILDKNIFTSITIGYNFNDQLKKTIKFCDDPSINFRIVNNTCEMCDITDCKERTAEPITLRTIEKSINIENAIKKL